MKDEHSDQLNYVTTHKFDNGNIKEDTMIFPRINYLEMADSNGDGSVTLKVTENLRILDLEGPEGNSILKDGSILVACTHSDKVCRYS